MTKLANNVRRVSGPDGAIVLHLDRGTMFRVSPMGVRILDLLEQGCAASQIAEQISRDCSMPLDVVKGDVHEFVLRLRTYSVLDSPAEKHLNSHR
jgi:hypothetical protein